MFESVLVDAVDAVTKLSAEDPALLGDAELLAAGESLTAIARRADAVRARVIAVVDARGSADVERGQPTAGWLSDSTGESRRGARHAVRNARGCSRLPVVAEAWADGRISAEHVSVLAAAVANPRVGDQIVGLQELLVGRAREVSFERWRREMRALVEMLDQDGGFRPDDEEQPSVLHLIELFDGTQQIRGDLNHADRATVEAALNNEADALYRAYVADRDATAGEVTVPSRAQLLAEALVSLCRKGTATDEATSSPARPEAIIVLRGGDGDVGDDGDRATINHHDTPVPVRRLRGLLSDAHWRRITLDAQGEVLDLGRARRLASRAQRRALEIRDGGCVFPGCGAPVNWCDVHHLDPWESGGATDLAQMALLCRRHHGVTHRKGWATRIDDGHLAWTTPAGQTLHAQRHGETRGSPPTGP